MFEEIKLFQAKREDLKQCENCLNYISIYTESNICPACEEMLLFADVRDFIRENIVNEFDVALHFNIPITKVQEWIKEGRIEYVTNSKKQITAHLKCTHCKKSIEFGLLCKDCQNLIKQSRKMYLQNKKEEDKMRFLNNNNKK